MNYDMTLRRHRYSPTMSLVSDTNVSIYPERLPQLNYSLFKENALRKKLVDLGIPSGGPKAVLIRRHTEWVNLVNANCDSSRPRKKRELLRDLTEWDKSQGRVVHNRSGHTGHANNSMMKKDFDGVAWGTAHNKDFQRLIQEARQRGSRKLDEGLGPSVENPEGVPASEEISIPEFASTLEVPVFGKMLHEESATNLQHLAGSEANACEANSQPGPNLASLNEHEGYLSQARQNSVEKPPLRNP